jgi:hypothetical protein
MSNDKTNSLENIEKKAIPELDTNSESIYILPSEFEAQFLGKMVKVFGIDEARVILRMIRAVMIRRLHTVLSWSNWALSKIDIAGIRIRASYSRYFGDLVYELVIRVTVEDIDPLLVKKNIRTLYKMAKIDYDQARAARDIAAVVEKYVKEEWEEEEEINRELETTG